MQVWISLRTLLDSLESATEYGKLNRINQRLLEWIAVRSQGGGPLHIQEIIMRSQVASPATIFKGLSNLEGMGLISVVTDSDDTRRRIVKITARTDRLFGQLSKAIKDWRRELLGVATTRKSKSGR